MFKRQKKEQSAERRMSPTSQSAPVFSYRSSRVRTEAPTGRYNQKAKTPRNFTYLINIPTYLALGLIIGSLCYAMTLTTDARIQVFNSQSTPLLRDKSVYAQGAQKELQRSLMNRFKFTLDTEHVAAELKKEFPELGAVSISIPLIDRHPIVQVTFSTPKLVLSTAQGDYIVSDSGHALVSTSEIRQGVNLSLPKVIDQTGLQVKQGDLALPPNSVQFISIVTAELHAKGQQVESLTLPTTPEELDLRLTGQAYYIKFNLLNDARQQVGTYLALQQKLTEDHTVPKQYIDLRVDERAYYQ